MKIAFLTALTFFYLFAIGQKVSKKLPPPTMNAQKQKIKEERCVFIRKYSDQQVLSLFPLNQTKAIKLISFEGNPKEEIGVLHRFYHFENDSFKIDSITIDTSNWREIIIISEENQKELVNLLYNYAPFKISKVGFDWEYLCYQPRNAIIFYNQQNQIIAVIEICFECEKMQFYPEHFQLGYNCTTKFELFRKFFVKEGIKYGVSKTNQSN